MDFSLRRSLSRRNGRTATGEPHRYDYWNKSVKTNSSQSSAERLVC